MASSVHQQIFDAVKFRFQEIRIAAGYETEIGAHSYAWRDLDNSPLEGRELPGFSLRDLERNVDGDGGTLNRQHFILRFEVKAMSNVDVSSPPDNHARRMIADLDKALGVDRRWTVHGIILAKDTMLDRDLIECGHWGERIVRVTKSFGIKYQTQFFNGYAQ